MALLSTLSLACWSAQGHAQGAPTSAPTGQQPQVGAAPATDAAKAAPATDAAAGAASGTTTGTATQPDTPGDDDTPGAVLARKAEQEPDGATHQPDAEPPPATYTVDFHPAPGVEADDGLMDVLRSASSLITLQNDPPSSLLGLEKRIDNDYEKLAAALRSEGYFDGSVMVKVDADAKPVAVVIEVTPGRRYTISKVTLSMPDGSPPPGGPLDLSKLHLKPGDPARGPAVRDAEAAVVPLMAARGYARAKVGQRDLAVDVQAHTMAVAFTLEPGPLVRFGPTTFTGLGRLDPDVAYGRLPWKEGDVYDPAKVDKARNKLTDLGVFSQVRVVLDDVPGTAQPDGSREVPMLGQMEERPRHFINTGLNYGTTDGAAATATWGDRNFLCGAEALTVTGSIGGIARKKFRDSDGLDYSLGTTLKKPDFLETDTTLNLSALAVSEHPEAYSRDALTLGAIVTHPLTPHLTASAGVTLEQSSIRQDLTGDGVLTTTDNTLVGLPVALKFDNTDNLLNPTQGYRWNAGLTPYLSPLGDSGTFVIGNAGASGYWAVDDAKAYVIAARVNLGAVYGGSLAQVPADKRFFAGGGGSVRGYAYQKVGPLDVNNDPTGGRSLIETSAELRIRLTDTIGLVPFIDGGNVFESAYPDLSQGMRWGAGLGVRYFTSFGPLRLDVGVPLDRRSGDSMWQLYVSIGQSF
ncbi:autotransporter assembly complex protein TamA [Nitrospirillum pindoramense]|uniref:Autotransporter secretion outer membrane protein TamA n=1 Tax=Nitrospirillum amazonense TaxID=28077 RepID=A0A560HJC2_9PROT|nr:autotransporter assembly complex family protein [Nitrospirillum amazonense]TWB45504.1 autotransporter secretion outer membrane protein TamA [Nitrospirillum amazonense]